MLIRSAKQQQQQQQHSLTKEVLLLLLIKSVLGEANLLCVRVLCVAVLRCDTTAACAAIRYRIRFKVCWHCQLNACATDIAYCSSNSSVASDAVAVCCAHTADCDIPTSTGMFGNMLLLLLVTVISFLQKAAAVMETRIVSNCPQPPASTCARSALTAVLLGTSHLKVHFSVFCLLCICSCARCGSLLLRPYHLLHR